MEKHMAEQMILNGPKDLIQLVAQQDFDPSILERVDFGQGFDLHFKICGDLWSGQIDYRVGRFIYELQRDIFTLYQEITGEKITYHSHHKNIEKILITATVKEGSTEFWVVVREAVKAMVKKMTGREIAGTALLAIALWCGNTALVSYNERRIKSEEIAAQLRISEGREETIRQSLEILGNSNLALAHLFARLDWEDTVSFRDYSGHMQTLDAQQIQNNLPETEQQLVEIRHMLSRQVWGRFKIIRQDNENFIFTLVAEGLPTIHRVITSFPNEAAQSAYFQKSLEFLNRSETPQMLLKLSVAIGDRRTIQNAVILEVLNEEPSDMSSIQALIESLPLE